MALTRSHSLTRTTFLDLQIHEPNELLYFAKYPLSGILLLYTKQTITFANAEHDKVQRKPRAIVSPLACQWPTLTRI